MKKGDIAEGRIEMVRYPNKGMMATADGIQCMVKNTCPGQKVQVRIGRKRHGSLEGTLLQILEKAPDEITPPCPQFGLCGGCTWLNLPYEKECALKQSQVQRLLEQAVLQNAQDPLAKVRIAPVENWFEKIIPSPVQYEYRNKMEFTFGDETKGGPLTLGMHRRGGFYDIIMADECRLIDDDFRRILRTVRDWCAENDIPYYHRATHQGVLRHLLVRKAAHTGEILMDLVTTSQQEHNYKKLAASLMQIPLEGSFAGILHTTNDSIADVIRDEGTRVLWGQEYFEEEILGLRFTVTPFSFFQTNSYGAEVLYEKIREYIRGIGNLPGRDGAKPVIFDLYTGTGTIAQLVAPAASKVIGVEIVEEAVEAARINAQRNGIDNCRFIAGDVLKVIDTIEEKPDLIILDPPREGIHPKALPKIMAYNVPYILYISCMPTSLARDLPVLAQGGYAPVRAVCVDQFPWTTGIETVCLLQCNRH